MLSPCVALRGLFPEKHLRPKEEIYNMTWSPAKGATRADGTEYPKTQKELGAVLKEEYHVRDKISLTNCSICHR